MGSAQSRLSDAEYGYDMVVATTQGSINGAMKAFLDGVPEPVVTMCYVADERGEPVSVPYEDLVKEANGTDPFKVPDDADPDTSPDLKDLRSARFMMGFQAQLGLPDGLDPEHIPDLVELGADTSAVKFNLLCSQFVVVNLDPGSGYTKPSWMNVAQGDGEPWVFSSKVDLRLGTAESSAYDRLPPAVQRQIKNLGGDAFSVRQLLFDLDNAALQTTPVISGVKPGTKLFTILQQEFVGAYFTRMRSKGEPLLSCMITRSDAPPSTLPLTDLNLEVCPFVGDNGQPIHDPDKKQRDLATLNYLCAVGGRPLAPATRFNWNWIDSSEQADYDGVAVVNRDTFVGYFRNQLTRYVPLNCLQPNVTMDMDGLTVKYGWSVGRGAAPKVTTPSSGQTVLTFSHSASSEDEAGVGGWGGAMKISTAFDLNVTFVGNKITIKQHLVVYVWVRSLATSDGGNAVDKTITDTYELAVDEHGRLVTDMATTTTDDSKPPGGRSGFLNFFTDINKLTSGVTRWVENFAPTAMESIPVAAVQSYVFPGGRDFAFKSVSFSDAQDLVSHITYTDPSAPALFALQGEEQWEALQSVTPRS